MHFLRNRQTTMTDILRRNSLLKSYNRSAESSLPVIQCKRSAISYLGFTYGKDYSCVKQEKTSGNCLQPVLETPNKKLPEMHVRLDRWIIKPFGDGICVEGHRRLTYFKLFTAMLCTFQCHHHQRVSGSRPNGLFFFFRLKCKLQ